MSAKQNIKQFIREYQLIGLVVGIVIGHFQHHIALYEWINDQMNSYNVVEEERQLFKPSSWW